MIEDDKKLESQYRSNHSFFLAAAGLGFLRLALYATGVLGPQFGPAFVDMSMVPVLCFLLAAGYYVQADNARRRAGR